MAHCHRPPHHGPPHLPPHCPPHRPQEKIAAIRNQRSGLVLDASEYEVKMQHFTGFPSQMWKLEDAPEGRFFLVNQANGKVLDIQGGAKKGANLITYQKHGGPNQQWSLQLDNTIVGADNLAVDISRANYCAGTNVIAYKKHGKHNQVFLLQYQ